MKDRHKIDNLLPLVADSWQQLRKSDVYRLMCEAREMDMMPLAMKVIKHERPEFSTEVQDAELEIWAEYDAPVQYHD